MSQKFAIFGTCALLANSFLSAQTQKSPSVMQRACGAPDVKFSTKRVDNPPSVPSVTGKALLYFISVLDYGGYRVGCQVVTRAGMDGKWLGANCASSYLVTAVEPGEHHLCADWQGTHFMSPQPDPALLSFNADAGKTYYFRAKSVYADGIASLDLQPVSADEGELLTEREHLSSSKTKR